MFNKRIYLDYASLTPVHPQVSKEVKKYISQKFANPGSIYKEGVLAKQILQQSKKKVADLLHAHSDEIVFTSGGTESNALVLHGTAMKMREMGIAKPHIIISAIEHSSIMENARILEKYGIEVTIISVDNDGVIDQDQLKKSIKPNTFLISVMTVNNEIGTVEPIKEISKIIRNFKKGSSIYPLFHTDAAQAHYTDLNLENMGVDLMTLDGSKIYGPRGIGCLYIKRNIPISPIFYGGGQENGFRSGTENIPAIAGFTKALELMFSDKTDESKRLKDLKKYFLNELKKIDSNISVNGQIDGSPHILNVSIPNIDNEYFVFQMDHRGIACSTKSSCLHDSDESYVLKAIGANNDTAVRFSFGCTTTKKDIKKTISAISDIIKK